AVAWDGAKVGAAEFGMVVRDPVVAQLSLPRFLAPGDKSQVAINLQNIAGPAGVYHVALTATGAVELGEPAGLSRRLEASKAASLVVPLLGRSIGEGTITLALDGPDGLTVQRQVTLGVRAAQLPTVQRLVRKLDPGEGVTLGNGALEAFLPGSGELLAR